MVLKLSSIRRDIDAENNGAWVPYKPWAGVKFHVRSLEYPAHRNDFNKMVRQFQSRRSETGGDIPIEEVNESTNRLLAKHILLGWEGLDEAYDKGLAERLLVDPAYRNLADAVSSCAISVGQKDLEFVDAESKNSVAPSDMSSKGGTKTENSN